MSLSQCGNRLLDGNFTLIQVNIFPLYIKIIVISFFKSNKKHLIIMLQGFLTSSQSGVTSTTYGKVF